MVKMRKLYVILFVTCKRYQPKFTKVTRLLLFLIKVGTVLFVKFLDLLSAFIKVIKRNLDVLLLLFTTNTILNI